MLEKKQQDKLKSYLELLKKEQMILTLLLKQEEKKSSAILKQNPELLYRISEQSDSLTKELSLVENNRNHIYQNIIQAMLPEENTQALTKIEQRYFKEKEKLKQCFQDLRNKATNNAKLLRQNIDIVNKIVSGLFNSKKLKTYNKQDRAGFSSGNYTEPMVLNVQS